MSQSEREQTAPLSETFEDRISRAWELANKLPLLAQVNLIKRVRFPSVAGKETSANNNVGDLTEIVAKGSEQVIDLAFQSPNLDALPIIRELVQLSPLHDRLSDYLAVKLEAQGKQTQDKALLIEAMRRYTDAKEQERMTEELGRIARQTNDWILLAKVGRLLNKFWDQKERVATLADELQKKAEDSQLRELKIEVARLLATQPSTQGQAIEWFLDCGCFEEARTLARDVRHVGWDLEKRMIESPSYNHEALLKGKGNPDQQIDAWLREGQPVEALKILIWNSPIYGKEKHWQQAASLIKEHDLADVARRIFMEMEPQRAINKLIELDLDFPQLFSQLVDKALRCSNNRLRALKEELWLIKLQIQAGQGEPHLNRRLTKTRKVLLRAVLEGEGLWSAISLAEKEGKTVLAKKFRTQGMNDSAAKTLGEEGDRAVRHYKQAADFAQQLGEPEKELEYLTKAGDYDKALSLALTQEWSEQITQIVSDYLDASPNRPDVLHKTIVYLQEREAQIPGAKGLIKQIASHLKNYWDEKGNFLSAAKMADILGMDGQADAYRELDILIPERYKEGSGGSGSCYITTACCDVMGLDDDCRILINLRKLRDNYISKLPKGKKLISLYYQTAPQVLQQLSRGELKKLFKQVIKPASDLVEKGENEKAYRLYRRTVQMLVKQYLPSKEQ